MAGTQFETLSSREARILELVRSGMPDAEIAVRLGSGIEETKARIRLLQERLGVPERTALTRWTVSPSADPDGAVATGPPRLERAPRVTRLRAWLFATVVVAGAFAAGLSVAALRPSGSAAPTPTAASRALTTVHSSPTAAAVPTAAPPVLDLPWGAFGRPATFPQNTVIVTTERCWQCGAAASAVVRYWRNEGEVHRTEVFRPAMVREGAGSAIWSFGMSRDGRRIVVGICVSRTCDWHDQGTTFQTAVALYDSRDTGATWELLGETSADVSIATVSKDDLVLRRITRSRGASWSQLLVWPGLEPLEAPPALGESVQPSVYQVGEPAWAWTGSGGVVTPSGEQILAGLSVTSVLPTEEGLAVSLNLGGDSPALVFTDESWNIAGGFKVPANMFYPAAALPGGTLVGNAEIPAVASGSGAVEWRPVLVGRTGTITPLAGSAGLEDASVEGARPGPVVEIDSPDSCAGAQSEPGGGAVVDCVADRVLLARRPGQPQADESGAIWLPVVAPGGEPAWVRAQLVVE